MMATNPKSLSTLLTSIVSYMLDRLIDIFIGIVIGIVGQMLLFPRTLLVCLREAYVSEY